MAQAVQVQPFGGRRGDHVQVLRRYQLGGVVAAVYGGYGSPPSCFRLEGASSGSEVQPSRPRGCAT